MSHQDLVPNKKIGVYVWNHQAQLGKGAYGIVYYGHLQSDPNQVVAIKQMDNSKLSSELMKQALQNELAILKLLKGAHTCGMFNYYQTNNNHYIIQTYCNSGDLRQLLNKRKKIPEEEALVVLKHILKGMQEMVGLQLTHRDLKPDNILIHDGIYKVADYGFSCKVQEQPMTARCGTPLYMSYQSLQGKPYTNKNDIWAIGLIFYEMLYGRTPWDCKNMQDLVQMPAKIPIKFPVQVPVSNMSKLFIQKCLQLEESKRICFQEIFASEIFTTTQVIKQVKMSQENKDILKQFQAICQRNNLDLQKIFDNFDKHKDHKLDNDELTKLFRVFDPNIQLQQCNEILRCFDSSNDGCLNFQEFQLLIEFTDFDEKECQGSEMLLQLKADKVKKDLRRVITNNELNLEKIFKKLDKNGNGNLDFDELKVLLKNIDKKLTDNEIMLVFRDFDKDNDGEVDFNEFEQAIFQNTNQNVMEMKPQNNSDTMVSQHMSAFLKKLKNTIINNELDLDMIFSHFDTDGNNSLDLKEFTQFIKVVYMKADPEDIKDAFKTLDTSGDKFIQIEEFKNLLR